MKSGSKSSTSLMPSKLSCNVFRSTEQSVATAFMEFPDIEDIVEGGISRVTSTPHTPNVTGVSVTRSTSSLNFVQTQQTASHSEDVQYADRCDSEPEAQTVEVAGAIAEHKPTSPAHVFEATEVLAKVPLYRLYSTSAADHFFTTNAAERDHAADHGYTYELPAAQILASPAEHSVPFFRIRRGNEHFYTIEVSEKERTVASAPDARDEGIAGYVYAIRQNGTVPLYRLYNSTADDHFYTTSAPEKEVCIMKGGWTDEGIACYVYP
ncbi:hypothetical protein BDW22DRAFT_858582 [Trametopsis cervina]|nr:hypothetical protein BDW22DRAFT_858582 [Trametopsis cervina]